MITVAQFAQYFQSLEPNKNHGRLTFYNFLKYGLPQGDEFKLDHIDVFYDRMMGNQYWQANKNILGEQLKRDLQQVCQRANIPLDFNPCVHASELQLVTLEQPRDFAALLAKQIEKMQTAGEKIKTFRLPNEKSSLQEVLFVRLLKDHSLIVEVRQNQAFLVEGELQLLRPHTRLVYDAELEFDDTVDQMLQVSPMRVGHFRSTILNRQRVKGHFVQYPHLQCTETFDRELQDVPELLHAIKRLERYYVNPMTDPYFQHFFDNINSGAYEKQI